MSRSRATATAIGVAVSALVWAFVVPSAAVALPPPPPNPSDAQLSGAAAEKAAASAAVSQAAANSAAMANQIDALEAQTLAAADEHEQAVGQLEIANETQLQTAQSVKDAAVAVGDAEANVATLAHNSYVQGNFVYTDIMLLTAEGPQDLIERSSMLTVVSQIQMKQVEALRLAKIAQANADSAAKQAVLDKAAAEKLAKDTLDNVTSQLSSAQETMQTLQAQKSQLDAQLAAAQSTLMQLEGAKQTYQQWLAQKQAEEAAAAAAAAKAAAEQAAAAQAAAAQAAAVAAAAAAAKPSGGGSSSAGSSSAGSSSGGPSAPPSNAGASNGAWALPAGGRLTTCFCMRWGEMHYGIDIAAPFMTPIYAAGSGTVKRAGSATGFGQAIYIQHASGWVTVYGHIEAIYVGVGQQVSAGQVIAGMGSRGFSTGVHLHFEVTKGMYGARVNPIPWLAARGIYL